MTFVQSNPRTNRPIVAAFDFDGTLTYGDTLLPFLLYTTGTMKALGKFIPQLPSLLAYACGIISRQHAKEGVLTRFFAGKPIAEIRKLGQEFAAGPLKKLVRPESDARLRWHQQQGHRCILISASLDVYLEAWGKLMGFREVISSRMEASLQGTATGRLLGLNCWGAEKIRRLNEVLGPRDGYFLYAYGDSQGDLELMAIADRAYYKKMPKPDAGVANESAC
jgi:phosphatidylglycerophosphatase C